MFRELAEKISTFMPSRGEVCVSPCIGCRAAVIFRRRSLLVLLKPLESAAQTPGGAESKSLASSWYSTNKLQPSSPQMTHRPIYDSSSLESTGPTEDERMGGHKHSLRNLRPEPESLREPEDLEPELDDGCDISIHLVIDLIDSCLQIVGGC